jgi:DNA-binding GntR family transcriptional regulator
MGTEESPARKDRGRVTVRKAVALLRDEGLVYTIQARGTFVRRSV